MYRSFENRRIFYPQKSILKTFYETDVRPLRYRWK